MLDASIIAAATYEKSKPEYRNRFGDVIKDPRPDIDNDYAIWVSLFAETDGKAPMLSDALFGLRCVGATLAKTESGYVLRPVIDETGNCGFADYAEYREQADKWLKPWVGPLKKLLASLDIVRGKWWPE